MENKIDILNELKELSPHLAAIPKTNVFSVPEGYFERLGTDILEGIRLEKGLDNDPALVFSGKEVPPTYFDSLADNILAKIKVLDAETAATEIRALSPMLYSIQNENVFKTPAGYFEGLSDDILNKVKPQSKLVSMKGWRNSFLKYAVAAAFTGMIALGVFKFTIKTGDEKILPGYVTAGLQVQDVDQELANIDDADIVNYLESTGTDVKAAMVANSIDKNELPAQEDYLLDEKALDKYLNSINIDELKN